MKFTLKSDKRDAVKIYVSEDGFYKIFKRPNKNTWELKEYSLFNIMGETIGEFDSLEEAMNF